MIIGGLDRAPDRDSFRIRNVRGCSTICWTICPGISYFIGKRLFIGAHWRTDAARPPRRETPRRRCWVCGYSRQDSDGEIEEILKEKLDRIRSGRAGAVARAQALTREKRREIAKKAASARWRG